MKTVWKILKCDLKDLFTVPRLDVDDYASIIVCSVVYYCSMAATLLGLHGIATSQLLSMFGGYVYLLMIWWMSAIVNLFIIANWPGMAYLDKGTITTRKLYFVAGPLLYPKVFCSALFLIIETMSISTVLQLLRRPINDWDDVSAFFPHATNKFVSSIERYRKYLLE